MCFSDLRGGEGRRAHMDAGRGRRPGASKRPADALAVAWCLLGWALVASPARAQVCIDYGSYLHVDRLVPTINHARRIAMSGNLAIVAEGQCYDPDYGGSCLGRLEVIGFPVGDEPVIVGGLALQWEASDVVTSGSHAYVATGGVEVVDLSNPAVPSLVDTVIVPAIGLAVQGSYLYVAGGGAGLTILDVSNPASPAIVGGLDTPGSATRVAVAGTLAFVADRESGLQVVDVSDPAAPTIVGSAQPPGQSDDVAVFGHHVVLGQTNGQIYDLVVVDVMNPAAPSIVSSIPVGGSGVSVAGTHAYVSGRFGMQVVDLEDPASPVVVGRIVAHAYSTTIVGARALVASSGGVALVDITNPASPASLGGVDTPDAAYDVSVVGTHAYVADGFSGLQVVDISNAASPWITGSVGTVGWPYGVAVSGSYAYLTCHYALGNFEEASLRVVDISNPSAPQLVGSLRVPGYARDVAISGHYAYIAAFNSVEVVDVSNPAAPILVGSVPTRGHVDPGSAIAVSESHAFVADGEAGLTVVDISNPGAPAIAGHLGTPGQSRAIAVRGTYAFIAADDGGGLSVVDISQPATPALVGRVMFSTGHASDVAVSGGYAYVSLYSESGLAVVDISQPAAPALVGTIEVAGHAWGLAVAAGVAYLANSEAGLTVLPTQCRAAIPVTFELTPGTLNLAAHAPRVTGYIEPPPPLAAADIDIGSIRLNGSVPVDPTASNSVGDQNGNGVPDLMVKFNRLAAGRTMPEGDDVAVTVTGTVDGDPFSGTDHIRVRRARVSASATGSPPAAGAVGAADHGPAPLALAIRAVSPNRSGDGRLRVEFALRDGGPARLELVDVAGRAVISRTVGSLGPGVHSIDLAQRGGLRAGIYFLRLTQGGSEAQARAAVLR